MSETLLTLSLAAAVASLALLALSAGFASQQTPVQDRRWHDPPPSLIRLCWPIVQMIAWRIDPRIGEGIRNRVQGALRQAGLEFSLEAAQFLAFRLWASLALAMVGALLGIALGSAVISSLGGALLGWLWVGSWLRDRGLRRRRQVARALPFYLDLVTLSVESGANLTGALAHAVDRGPSGPLREELARVLRDIRAGRTRAEALRAMSDRLEAPAVGSWVSALISAERHGSGLGAVLRGQAEQRRQERFQLAEKLAMQAPVKMLFPLLAFIFPCTFLLLFFPIAVRLVQEGLLR